MAKQATRNINIDNIISIYSIFCENAIFKVQISVLAPLWIMSRRARCARCALRALRALAPGKLIKIWDYRHSHWNIIRCNCLVVTPMPITLSPSANVAFTPLRWGNGHIWNLNKRHRTTMNLSLALLYKCEFTRLNLPFIITFLLFWKYCNYKLATIYFYMNYTLKQ